MPMWNFALVTDFVTRADWCRMARFVVPLSLSSLFPLLSLSHTYTTMSREGTPSSDTLIDIDNFDENEVTDLGLKNLLKREIELQLLIDALQTEISQLEERINGKDQGDEEEELDDQGMVFKYIVARNSLSSL